MRGFDFGCWSPLALMFPDASVPIVQVSIHGDLDPRTHVAMGEALAPLRDEGISPILNPKP
jgi:aromatic ring-opening dioxygenase catalytic subunit (LigB family)